MDGSRFKGGNASFVCILSSVYSESIIIIIRRRSRSFYQLLFLN